MRRTVLVGVEGLPHSDDALVWAARAAEQRGAVLRLVHATGSPILAIDVLDDESFVAGAETLLAKAAARVAEVAPRVDVETLVDRRLPAQALTDGASGAELVVVGTHRLSVAERVFAGSLAYQVAAGAACPVVVVPGPVALDATGVVVGVDGSADGLEAVALGAAEADRTGQALHVVHAWQEPAVYAAVDVVPAGTAEVVRDAERVALSESVAGLGEKYPDLVVHELLVHGQPATALLDAAEDSRLVVIGSRGRHGLARLLLGSVSHTVVLHASCPVMVARVHHVEPQHD
jgi:nucleotide-binding universal stress UspA family protein